MKNKLNYKTTTINNDDNKNTKTVLFLHGWGGSINSFLFTQRCLAGKVNTINLDFFGFGASKEPETPYDTYLYALSVYELLLELNVKKVSIVAHSFGGRIAILLSSIFDIEVEHLILVNSAGLKPRRNLIYYIKVYTYKMLKWGLKKGIVKKSWLKHFGSSDYKQLSDGMKKTFINIVNQHLHKYLKEINCKTLIIWGEDDKVTPLYMAKKLKNNIKNSTLKIYKKSGHFSYLENMADFCNTVEDFILQQN